MKTNTDLNQATQFAVRKLLQHPTNPWKEQLQNLLQRAETGADITIETMDLLGPHENVRLWMRTQIAAASPSRTLVYIPPAGNISPIRSSQLWICPKKGCEECLPVIREEEDAPYCDLHQVRMVRANTKR